jgi:deazaflavin-dependent oxidoreductase (nitroreductase family)
MLENVQRSPRSMNRRANAFFLKIAGGHFRAYSLLKHVGRKSGREYRTPITAFPLGDGFVLALLYGDAAEVDWCRNVMAAGTCILKTRRQEYMLEKPEIIPPSKALEAYPPLFRFYYRAAGIRQFLWIHRKL